jgi:hypothetical protein
VVKFSLYLDANIHGHKQYYLKKEKGMVLYFISNIDIHNYKNTAVQAALDPGDSTDKYRFSTFLWN